MITRADIDKLLSYDDIKFKKIEDLCQWFAEWGYAQALHDQDCKEVSNYYDELRLSRVKISELRATIDKQRKILRRSWPVGSGVVDIDPPEFPPPPPPSGLPNGTD